MLPVSKWWVNIFHLCADFFQEEGWSEYLRRIWMLNVSFISRVDICHLVSSFWPPSFWPDESIVEDFVSIYIYKLSVSVICDSSSVIALSNQILDSCPLDWLLLVVVLICWLTINLSSHIVCENVLTYLEVRVIEGICDVPAEGLELLSLDKDSVEPDKSENSFSEFLAFLNLGELSLVSVNSKHVSLDSFRWFHCNFLRSLEKRDREVRMRCC